MTVLELIDALAQMDPHAEVRLAHQPQWAFEHSIDEVAQVDPPRVMERAEFDALDEDAQERVMEQADEGEIVLVDEGEPFPDPQPIVYIAEGGQIGYLPQSAARAIGWGR